MTSIDDNISRVIGTAGHIDHGKTALVRALTGMDTDRLKDEKKRGISIDLGFAFLDLQHDGRAVRAAIVDVPGHERFIKNMLAGTTGIDLALFCVAADDGVMPQTREHLDIVRLLGVKKSVFAITKSDLAGTSRISVVAAEIETLISGCALEGSPILEVSTVTGQGVEELKAFLAKMSVESRRSIEAGFFRLPVDRSFSVKGFGTVVTGTIASGSVRKGDELLCFPSGRKVRARGIQSHLKDREKAQAGQRAALNLSGIGHDDIGRGDVVCSPELMPFLDAADGKRTRLVDCVFEFLPASPNLRPRPIKNRAVFKAHHLTGEELATVLLAGKSEVLPGEKVLGRLALKGPLLMMRGDRFILRDTAVNATIGGGEVMAPHISRITIAPGGRGDYQNQSSSDIILRLLPDKAAVCLFSNICLMLGRREEEASGLLDSRFERRAEFLVIKDRLDEARNEALGLLAEFHGERPMEAGAGEEFFRNRLKDRCSGLPADRTEEFIRWFLEKLVNEGSIRKAGGLFCLPSFRASAMGADGRVEDALMEIFSKFQPDLEALHSLPFKRQDIEKVLAYLQRSGAIVKLREGSHISSIALKDAREKMEVFIREKGGIHAAEFRDLVGCGRKLAIEILEFFDKERVTLRNKDDVRTLR